MKKIVLTLSFLAIASMGYAQYNNEVKLNIFNTIALGSVEIGYEYFLDSNQSIGVEYFWNDRFSYYSEGDEGKKFDINSIAVSYNFYFVRPNNPSGYFLSPSLKYRYGSYEELGENDVLERTDMDGFIIAITAGYKWVYNEKLALGPYINIGRAFSEEVVDRFPAVEVNAGFSFGYRF